MTDTPPPISPLAEASPFSLEEFFSRAPWTLSTEDRAKAVAIYRAQRAAWDLAEAGGAKRAPSAKKAAATVTLADLGLDEEPKAP